VSFRFYGVSLIWATLLTIILLGINSPNLNTGSSFAWRFALQYFFGFGLLAFSVCSSLKKQLKRNYFRRNAFQYSVAISIGLLLIIEIVAMNIYPGRAFQFFWSFCAITGIIGGLGAFRLLYDACC
jgi:asparagine N-glycosylation enzyme membrane subunit Stt3